MKQKTKKKKTVNAWAVGNKKVGLFDTLCFQESPKRGVKPVPNPETTISVFRSKSDAKLFAHQFQKGWEHPVLITRCTITYEF